MTTETKPAPDVRTYTFPTDPAEWTDADFDRARDLARTADWQEHKRTVSGVVDDLIDRVKRGEITDSETLDEAAREACDGCLVYTADCEAFLRASDNESAWEDAGFDSTPDDYIRAGLALEADVTEALNDAGYGYDGEAWDEADDETPVDAA